MRSIWTITSIALLALIASSTSYSQKALGYFKGEFIARFLSDGRNIQLETPFGYVDPNGLHWDVPVGAMSDGASVPQIFWTLYPPFTGQYRSGAMVHDYYCQVRTRSWRDTHKVFYNAMLTAGVTERSAKVMYGAVYYFGPRWGIGAQSRGPGTERGLTLDDQARFVKNLDAWVDLQQPTIQQIEDRLEGGAEFEKGPQK